MFKQETNFNPRQHEKLAELHRLRPVEKENRYEKQLNFGMRGDNSKIKGESADLELLKLKQKQAKKVSIMNAIEQKEYCEQQKELELALQNLEKDNA